MPATPSRAAFIREPYRRAVAITPDATTRFGYLARVSEDPVETFFDDIDDAQTRATERQALLGDARRSFEVEVADIDEVLALDYTGQAVLARYVDEERGLDQTMLVSEIVLDLENERAVLSVWG